MCRFALYLGPPITISSLVVEPDHSIIHQSFHSKERDEPLNGDGFGVAWYAPDHADEPALFKDVSPAWNNENLRQLARVTQSECILVHIRAASPGLSVNYSNCHPFAWQQFAFMHNGDVAGFKKFRRAVGQTYSDEIFSMVRGTTDSEHLFGFYAERLRDHSKQIDVQIMANALAGAIDDMMAHVNGVDNEHATYLNLAVTDGKRAVVCRYVDDPKLAAHTLYFSCGDQFRCVDGVCEMGTPGERGAVLVASEPLSSSGEWQKVPANHLLMIDEFRNTAVTPLQM